MTWPSGLRRQLKALVRKGAGSNPAVIILLLFNVSHLLIKLYINILMLTLQQYYFTLYINLPKWSQANNKKLFPFSPNWETS
jgi:hypothetical protein